MGSNQIVARLHRMGKKFEILVWAEKAYEYMEKKKGEIRDIVVIPKIYLDIRKGMEAPKADLIKAFGTDSPLQIAREILDKGEIQITTEKRRKLIEEKKKRVIDYIHRNTVDPRTNTPHSRARIEKALEEAKVKIDPFRDPLENIEEIISKISRVLPIRMGYITVKVKFPPETAMKGRSYIAKYGKVVSEKWKEDGSLIAEVEAPVGNRMELLETIGKLGGEVEEEK